MSMHYIETFNEDESDKIDKENGQLFTDIIRTPKMQSRLTPSLSRKYFLEPDRFISWLHFS
jgi:hypothetical protein